jgi:hypothetical protein
MALHLFTSLPLYAPLKAISDLLYTRPKLSGQAANSIYSLEFQLDIVASIPVSRKEKKMAKQHPKVPPMLALIFAYASSCTQVWWTEACLYNPSKRPSFSGRPPCRAHQSWTHGGGEPARAPATGRALRVASCTTGGMLLRW